MKFINKTIKRLDSLISTLTISLLLILMIFGVYALYDVYKVYDSGKLDNDIAELSPREKGTKFNLSELRKLNKDIVGWVIIDDTNIDYPILKGKDNSKYLTTNYRGEYAAAGSIFLDYRNNDLKDDYSIIYGHNMNANLMFGDIKSYKDEMFFKHHLSGKLYTTEGSYKLTVIAYARVSAYDGKVYSLDEFRNNRNFEVIHEFINISKYTDGLENSENEQLLLLSTCDASGVNERNVILTKLKKLTSDEEKEIAKEDKNIIKAKKAQEEKEKRNFITKYFDMWDLMFILLIIPVAIIYLVLYLKTKKNKKKKNTSIELLDD